MANTSTPLTTFSGSMLGIVLDKEIYNPGDIVTGRVLVRLYRDFPLQKIEIELLGTESFTSLTQPNKSFSKEIFIRKSELNPTSNGEIMGIGRYEFPFIVQLPLQSNGSCKIIESKFKSKTKYKLTFTLFRTYLSSIEGGNIVSKQTLKVREISRKDTAPLIYEAEVFKTVYSCFGCVNQKDCQIMCQLDNNDYEGSDTCNLRLLVHNSSGLDIVSFSVSLHHVFAVNLPNTSSNLEIANLKEEILREQIHEAIFKGQPARTQSVELSLPLLLADDNKSQILAPSSQGMYTLNYYFIEVKAHFEGCSVQSIILQIPINIFLSTKEPQRTPLDIEKGIYSKEFLQKQNCETVIEDFNESIEEITVYPQIQLEDYVQGAREMFHDLRIGNNNVFQSHKSASRINSTCSIGFQ